LLPVRTGTGGRRNTFIVRIAIEQKNFTNKTISNIEYQMQMFAVSIRTFIVST
jgi:hypothetical protein